MKNNKWTCTLNQYPKYTFSQSSMAKPPSSSRRLRSDEFAMQVLHEHNTRFQADKATANKRPKTRSTKKQARTNRRSRLIKKSLHVGNGDLDKYDWEIRRGVWKRKDLDIARKLLREGLDIIKSKNKIGTRSEEDKHRLRGDPNKLNLWLNHKVKINKEWTCIFPARVTARAIDYTEAVLGLKIMEQDQASFNTIFTMKGAWEQWPHQDAYATAESVSAFKVYSVLHCLTKRLIHVHDERGWHDIDLKAGDVLYFSDKCCHAGAAHDSVRMSMAIHVALNYDSTKTSSCFAKPDAITYDGYKVEVVN
jgi:hypothetical protein